MYTLYKGKLKYELFLNIFYRKENENFGNCWQWDDLQISFIPNIYMHYKLHKQTRSSFHLPYLTGFGAISGTLVATYSTLTSTSPVAVYFGASKAQPQSLHVSEWIECWAFAGCWTWAQRQRPIRWPEVISNILKKWLTPESAIW